MSKKIEVSQAPTAPTISRIASQGGSAETYNVNLSGARPSTTDWRLPPTPVKRPGEIAGGPTNAGPGTLLTGINEAADSAQRTGE